MQDVPHRRDTPPSCAEIRDRLRSLVSVCSSADEALLFVTGIDGKYNAGSVKAINYLFGFSGVDLFRALPEEFDDVSDLDSASLMPTGHHLMPRGEQRLMIGCFRWSSSLAQRDRHFTSEAALQSSGKLW